MLSQYMADMMIVEQRILSMMETVKKRDILHAVESAIGELKTY
ncbi:MAG: hypothetical protein NTZ12_00075 [Candidatus Aminicenantes bacterium]|nr:hypothetical protein [Candidatus Aminicenantes bacterium]